MKLTVSRLFFTMPPFSFAISWKHLRQTYSICQAYYIVHIIRTKLPHLHVVVVNIRIVRGVYCYLSLKFCSSLNLNMTKTSGAERFFSIY